VELNSVSPARRRTGRSPQPGHLAGCRASILGGIVFPPIDGTVSSEEEREMSTIADINEPISELERLIADLSKSG
jgi:hypothetical protein